jgi:hypothetical protein
MKEIFRFDSYFIHQKLIFQLVDSKLKKELSDSLRYLESYDEMLKKLYTIETFTNILSRYLGKSNIKSLEEYLLKGENLKTGDTIWFHNNFYFKGINDAKEKMDKGYLPSYASFHIKLKRYDNLELKGKFNVEHIFSSSALNRLSGNSRKFMVAYIEKKLTSEIVLRPIFIGDKFLTDEETFEFDSFDLSVDISKIDEFQKISNIPHSDSTLDIKLNKQISEEEIKAKIAEILFEKNVPKDWGGEMSDLFTNHIHINGKRYKAAFLLKGPSKFHPMSVKDLGSNGNQIVRLFDESADILILQHCHYIKQEIYKTMEAFASRFNNIRRYCIIDGIDTQRLFKAYGKM